MRLRKTFATAALCLALLGGLTAVHAAATVGSASETQVPARPPTTAPSREGGTLDKFTGVAAVLSILIVGVAGVYIYRLIRKGL
jgi:hypothetical protein